MSRVILENLDRLIEESDFDGIDRPAFGLLDFSAYNSNSGDIGNALNANILLEDHSRFTSNCW